MRILAASRWLLAVGISLASSQQLAASSHFAQQLSYISTDQMRDLRGQVQTLLRRLRSFVNSVSGQQPTASSHLVERVEHALARSTRRLLILAHGLTLLRRKIG